jgi:hypothetical protein
MLSAPFICQHDLRTHFLEAHPPAKPLVVIPHVKNQVGVLFAAYFPHDGDREMISLANKCQGNYIEVRFTLNIILRGGAVKKPNVLSYFETYCNLILSKNCRQLEVCVCCLFKLLAEASTKVRYDMIVPIHKHATCIFFWLYCLLFTQCKMHHGD